MAVTPKECAVLIEPPSEEISAAHVRTHELEITSSEDPAIPRHTTKTFGKWFTPGKQDTRAKQNTHGNLDTYRKCDLDAKWNAYGRLDQGASWDPTDFPEDTCIQHAGSDSNPRFKIGQERELIWDNKNQLAALSPMSDTMFGVPGTENKDAWQDVVKTTNNSQVAPLACKCFDFLLHHPCQHNAEHLRTLLETAHHLHSYREEYDQCLAQVSRHGGKVLSKPTALAQLCNDCLLDIVQADHLQGADGILVSNTIPATHCTLQDPIWEKRCGSAGELVHYGRNLTLPGFNLIHHPEGPSSSSDGLPSSSSLESPSLPLLMKDKVDGLVHREGPQFSPAKVREKKRWVIQGGETKDDVLGKRMKQMLWVGLVIFILLFTFLVQYVLVHFLVGPLIHDMQEADTSSERAVNQTRYS